MDAKSAPQGFFLGAGILNSRLLIRHGLLPPPPQAQWDYKLALKPSLLSSTHLSLRASCMCGTVIASGIRFAEVT